MHRFFVGNPDRQNAVELRGADARHLTKVLRLRPGDRFVAVLDGLGQFEACIEDARPGWVRATLLNRIERDTETRARVFLFQALPKADKMDDVVQRCTEIGVYSVIPVYSERTVALPDPARLKNRLGRWRKIAAEAAELAGRTHVPSVEEPMDLRAAFCRSERFDLRLMPWEGERSRGLKAVLHATEPKPQDVFLLIGPEGGFSDAEAERARSHGVVPVTLGPRMMRTQNAGAVALALILYELGDMG